MLQTGLFVGLFERGGELLGGNGEEIRPSHGGGVGFGDGVAVPDERAGNV